MPGVGFESTIPVFERAKTVHALDRVAKVIGWQLYVRTLVLLIRAGRSRLRFMISLDFSADLILPVALCPWDGLSL
jgi:hypothetical protein